MWEVFELLSKIRLRAYKWYNHASLTLKEGMSHDTLHEIIPAPKPFPAIFKSGVLYELVAEVCCHILAVRPMRRVRIGIRKGSLTAVSVK